MVLVAVGGWFVTTRLMPENKSAEPTRVVRSMPFDEPDPAYAQRHTPPETPIEPPGADAATAGVLNYLHTHSLVPDWKIFQYFRHKGGGPD